MAGGDRIVVERRPSASARAAALDVDVGDGKLRLAAKRLDSREQLAEFVDRALPVPGEVGGALARARGGVDIGGAAAEDCEAQSSLRSSALPMVMLEADRLHRISAPASAPTGGGRLRRPIILANLHVEDEVVEVLGGEDEVGAERHELAGDGDVHAVEAEAHREPALLIIFAVIGQEALRAPRPGCGRARCTSAQL
jgi:hypothetical protein